ncbi:gluconate 2-dehydrogenase subunit 3 family protein [Dyadobacter luticola]|uniref:Gluconate 2-dehydrogenase subunit 3 family protein n=1 Tax=Dyadobacter luticola TaxID=1979387 RepID=A0A5R9KT81_9BACT|nr:gluconate 2-dehydrogenase subunit 3 family protein [Dyadobacter luticola]TLU99410.1 gluconate 2-dehydrogenase subunit 3 family protein [Dyadobacter luticola]
MKRRDALGRVALLMGGTLSAPTLLAFLEGCKSTTETSSAITFPFSPERKALVSEIAEIIIPKTDTPGAKEAKVGEFIELMIKDCYTGKDQESFEKGLKELEKKDFMKADAAKQTAMLKESEAESTKELTKETEEKKKYTEAGKEYTDAPVPFFRLFKELTLLGYFTSEQGATLALDYVPVPGRYDGCIDLKPDQKAWAM